MKTITRTFDDDTDARDAVHALEQLGVPRAEISILANNSDGRHAAGDHEGLHDGPNHDGDVSRGASTGAAIGGVGGLLAGLGLLAIPGLGPIVAAGWLAATVTGAGLGALGGAATGGIVGALKGAGHSDEEAHVYSESVRRGGTLVSARVDDGHAERAIAALANHRAVDATTRGAAYRASGWTGYDEASPAYTSEQIAAERASYRSNEIVT